MPRTRKGNSLIELLLVIGIIAVLALVSSMALFGRKGTTEFNGTVKQMVAVLREAQSRSMSQASGTTWGVYFSNSTSGASFALFAGASYSPATQRGFYKLSSVAAYTTSSIDLGASKTVLFAQITGTTVSTTIGLYSLKNAQTSSTLSVASSGAISY